MAGVMYIERYQDESSRMITTMGREKAYSPVEPSINNMGTNANIVVNEETMQTTRKGVFAGGDIVTGGATVILAAGAGKVAARAMHKYMTEEISK